MQATATQHSASHSSAAPASHQHHTAMLGHLIARNEADDTDLRIDGPNDQLYRDDAQPITEIRLGSPLTSDLGRQRILFGGDQIDHLTNSRSFHSNNRPAQISQSH